MAAVKCIECGRTRYDGRRVCDVCGGRMTETAANCYFTPEGPVSKRKYHGSSRSYTPRHEDDERYDDSLVKAGGGDLGRTFGKNRTKSKSGKYFKLISVIIILAAIVTAGVEMLESNPFSPYDSYESSGSEENNIDVNESVSYEAYTIDLHYVNHSYGLLDFDITIANDSDEDIVIEPAAVFSVSIDETEAYMAGIYADGEDFTDTGNTFVLEAGMSYSFWVYASDENIEDWDIVTLFYNLSGDGNPDETFAFTVKNTK